MFTWGKYPLLRIFGCFLLGIIIAFNFSESIQIHPVIGMIVTGIIIVIYAFTHSFISYKNRIVAGIFVFLLMFWMGCFTAHLFTSIKKEASAAACGQQKQMFIGDVKETPVLKNKSVKMLVNIIQYQDSIKNKSTNFDMILYLKKDSRAENIQYGDRIVFYVRPQFVDPPKNPSEFNYKRYLKIKNIYLQAYVDDYAWEKISEKHGNKIMIFASGLRQNLLKILDKSNLEKNENAVISAILLGVSDKLDPELSQQYASAGVSHILCVSGMHVGVIYMIINYLLFFLSKGRIQKSIKTIVLLLTIWLYACVTGLSPSVMRASTMFTFMAFGHLFERQPNTYNSILTSLFFLCCLNPLIIYEVGVQLSYSAVFGIVWLQKPIKTIYKTKTKVGKHIWEIMAVSFVAQLLTFPFSMYYFHQFPTYFLLANIAIISLTPFVVGTGILYLVLSFWTWTHEYLSLLLNYMIKSMNYVVSFVEKLPFSTLGNLYINSTQLLLLYACILCFAFAVLYKRKFYFFISLFSVSAILFINLHHKNKNLHSHEMLIYSINKGYIMDCICGHTIYTMGDSTSLSDNKKHEYHTENYRIKKGIKNQQQITDDFKDERLYKSKNYIQFCNTNLLVVDNRIYFENNTPEKLKIDYLLIDNNPNVKIDNLLKMIDANTIIFTTNNSYFKTNVWKKECDSLKIAYHDLREGHKKIML